MKKVFTEEQLPEIAKIVLQNLKPHNKALVVALYGDLGAGKTSLTKEIARELGIKENVNSPTFVLIKNYKLRVSNYEFKKLIHIDAYRLNSEEELLKLGWDELIDSPANLIFIEWPERVKKLIPQNAIKIYLEHTNKKHSIDIRK